MYKKVIKPILFLFPPDFVHTTIATLGRLTQSIAPLRWLLAKLWRRDSKKLEQNILGLNIKSPIGLSAGFDKNIELTPLMDAIGFGFETGGSVTLGARRGNKRPWFYRLPKTQSIVVHAGLANQGITKISPHLVRNQKRVRDMKLFISVAVVARSKHETAQDAIIDAKNTVMYISQRKLAQAIEINISCPNVEDDQPFTQPALLHELLSELDKLNFEMPIFIKMPNLNNMKHFDALLKVISIHKVQGVTVANLVKDRENVDIKDELSDGIKGGLSGLPTRDRSTELIRRTYRLYGGKLVIIGVGGVFSAEHAYEKIRAGASLVGMVTGLIFEGPQVVGRINKQLEQLIIKDGFADITEVVGADHKNHQKTS